MSAALEDGKTNGVESALGSVLGDLDELRYRYDERLRTLFVTMCPTPYPRLTEGMTASFLRLAAAITSLWGRPYPAASQPVKFMVLDSSTPEMFSAGGDLSRILAWLETGDRVGLRAYFEAGTKSFHALMDGFGANVVTVAAVSGKAMGGGFECARACDFLVADETAAFSFPETKFGLFPGNGSISIVGLRHGEALLRRMTLDGDVLSAEEAGRIGVADAIVSPGKAVEEASSLVERLLPRHAAVLAVRRGMQRTQGITLESMLAETERYLAAAEDMGGDLATIRRIVALQERAATRRRG